MQSLKTLAFTCLLLGGALAQTPAPPRAPGFTPPAKAEAAPAGKAITDTDRFKIRELEARLLQVDNQVKDWQLTGRPKAQEAITAAYQEMQAKCAAGQQLDPNTISCVTPPPAPKEEKVTAKKQEEEK